MLDFEASNSSQLHFIHLKDAQGLHPALPRKMDGSEVKVNLRDTYLQGIKFEDSAFMLDVQNCHSEGGISILRGKISELRLVNNNFQEFSVDSSDVQYMEMDETKGPAVGLVPNIEFDGTSFDEIELTLKDPMRFFRYTHFSGKCKKLKIVNDGMYVDIEHYVIWKADESEFILEPRDHQEFIHYAQETGKVLSFFSDENFYIAYPGDKEMRQVHFYSGEERPVSRKSSWELVQGAWRKAEGLTVIDVPDSLGVEEMQNWVAQTVLYLQNPRSVQKWQEENPGLTFSITPRVTKIS